MSVEEALYLPSVVVQSPNTFQIPPWVGNPTPIYGLEEVNARTNAHINWIRFPHPFLLFGKDPALCHIFVGHPTVSNQHAAIIWDKRDTMCYIQDLESSHGTFLNDTLIGNSDRVDLRPNVRIRFGNSSHCFIFKRLPAEMVDDPPAQPIPASVTPPPPPPPLSHEAPHLPPRPHPPPMMSRSPDMRPRSPPHGRTPPMHMRDGPSSHRRDGAMRHTPPPLHDAPPIRDGMHRTPPLHHDAMRGRSPRGRSPRGRSPRGRSPRGRPRSPPPPMDLRDGPRDGPPPEWYDGRPSNGPPPGRGRGAPYR